MVHTSSTQLLLTNLNPNWQLLQLLEAEH